MCSVQTVTQVSGRSFAFNYFRKPRNHLNLYAAVEIRESSRPKTLPISHDAHGTIDGFRFACKSEANHNQRKRQQPQYSASRSSLLHGQ